jgi:hypothetical protein
MTEEEMEMKAGRKRGLDVGRKFGAGQEDASPAPSLDRLRQERRSGRKRVEGGRVCGGRNLISESCPYLLEESQCNMRLCLQPKRWVYVEHCHCLTCYAYVGRLRGCC